MQPAFEKDNPATRAANEIAMLNAQRGNPAGRGYGTGKTMVEPASMHRPPAIVRELPPVPQEEIDRLNQLAMAAGVRPEDLGEVAPSPETIVGPDVRALQNQHRAMQGLGAYGGPLLPSVSPPRLPDFTKVESIDLKNGCVIVDGLRFPVPAADLRDMYMYVMEIVQEAVMDQFRTALASVMGGVSDTSEDVSALPAGDAQGQPREVHPVRESEESEVEAGEPRTDEGASPPNEPA